MTGLNDSYRCLFCDAELSNDGAESRRVCEIRGLVTQETYRPNEPLFQQGRPVVNVYLIRSGFAKLTASLSDGRVQGLHFGARGSVLGLEAMNEEMYPFTAEAVTRLQVCVIRRDQLLRVLEQNPATALQLITLLNRQLRRALYQIRDLGVMDATERVAAFLLAVASGSVGRGHEHVLPLSRKSIGQMLGLTEETMSRTLARLKRAKVIDMPAMSRQFRVLDHARLFSLAGEQSGPASSVFEALSAISGREQTARPNCAQCRKRKNSDPQHTGRYCSRSCSA